MGSPNQSFKFPELSRLDPDAQLWAFRALAGVELQAFSNAMLTKSRMDLELRSMAQQTTRQASEPYWIGSQAIREQAARYVPDRLSAEDEALSRDETARLLAEVERYRARAGMPVKHEVAMEPVSSEDIAALPDEVSAYLAEQANAGTTGDNVSPEDVATLHKEVDAYLIEQAKVGVPAGSFPASESASQTPMQYVETQLPEGNLQSKYEGTPVDKILEQIGYLHDQAENE